MVDFRKSTKIENSSEYFELWLSRTQFFYILAKTEPDLLHKNLKKPKNEFCPSKPSHSSKKSGSFFIIEKNANIDRNVS